MLEQTAIISLYHIKRIIFIIEKMCVYCKVRTEFSRIILVNFRLYALKD